ncbi:MAG: HNH endonuclease family protein, partial [Umezawaea sp.]
PPALWALRHHGDDPVWLDGFFRDHVQNTGSLDDLLVLKPDACETDAQRTIVANARALHSALKTWSDDERVRLGGMMSARTFLVVVKTPDLGSAHRIFSVMNARGLDLTPADVFKSMVLGKLPSDLYGSRWEDAEAELGRDKFAELFLHLRMVFVKERSKTELLKEFPEQVLEKHFPDREAEFVDDVVVPYAKAYAQIRDFQYTASTGADKVNAWFKRLAQIDNNDWVPPALWALRHHGDDPVWLDGFFRALERLAASLFIRRIYTTPRVGKYADLLRDLADGKGLDSPAFELDADERASTRAQLDGDLYLVTKIRKYVLLRLDEVLANGSGVVYDHSVITVEHVLPQNPKTGSAWRAEFSDDDRAEWTHRLANLVLLNRAKNSQASNSDFDYKKANYFLGKHGTSNFAVTNQVLSHTAWTPEVLESRQRELVKSLAYEWNL